MKITDKNGRSPNGRFGRERKWNSPPAPSRWAVADDIQSTEQQ